MSKKKLLISIFFVTVVYLLTGNNTIVSNYVTAGSGVESNSSSIDNYEKSVKVKPYAKAKKIKLRVRFKGSEVKFDITSFHLIARTFFTIPEIRINNLFIVNPGFHSQVKLRGPPVYL